MPKIKAGGAGGTCPEGIYTATVLSSTPHQGPKALCAKITVVVDVDEREYRMTTYKSLEHPRSVADITEAFPHLVDENGELDTDELDAQTCRIGVFHEIYDGRNKAAFNLLPPLKPKAKELPGRADDDLPF